MDSWFMVFSVLAGSSRSKMPRKVRNASRSLPRTGKTFAPSAGPGYVDTRIRPWKRAHHPAAGIGDLFRAALE